MTVRSETFRRLAYTLVIVACGNAPINSAALQLPVVEMARVTVPAAITFRVNDIGASSDAVTGTTIVTFDQADLAPGRALRISVKAEGELTRSDGSYLTVTAVTWRASGVVNGVGVNGTLSKTIFAPVFQSDSASTSGSVTLTWSVALSDASVRAGTYQAPLRWKIESIVP